MNEIKISRTPNKHFLLEYDGLYVGGNDLIEALQGLRDGLLERKGLQNYQDEVEKDQL